MLLNLFNVADFEMQNASPIRDFFFFLLLRQTAFICYISSTST